MIFKKKFKTSYLLAISFVAGLLFWKIKPSIKRSKIENQISYSVTGKSKKYATNKTLVSINNSTITLKDLEWEYHFQTQSLEDNEKLNPNKSLSNDYSTDFLDLKKQLLSELVERKVLLSFIKKDSRFDFDNKIRRRSCESQLEKIIKEKVVVDEDGYDILKSRLCETDLIEQYMSEMVRTKINVTEDELREYYDNNKEDFHHKRRVVVRQIVLATEQEARKIRPKLNKGNFRSFVQDFSISPEPNEAGVYGPLEKGQYSGAFDVAFRLRKGRISNIVKTAYGFQILLVVDKLKAGFENYAQVKSLVEAEVVKRKFASEYEKILENALTASTIKSEEKIW